ncbi:MAG: sulfotransferase [Candidatus Paceibacterota bacterium]
MDSSQSPTESTFTAMSPVVITGCPRSGTLMMGRILGSLSDEFFLITEHHNKQADIPEDQSGIEDHRLWWKHFEYEAWDTENQRPRIDVPQQDPESINSIRDHYLRLANGRRIVIKNPSHILYPELIRRIFPDAQFVFCVRNPWPTFQSMIKRGRDSFLLRSPRIETDGASLLLKAAIGWHDAISSFFQHQDCGWVIAQYERIAEFPRERISELCERLHIQKGDGFERAVAIPQPSPNNNFYFIKQAYERSAEKPRIQQELLAGCEHFGYPLTPEDLPGNIVDSFIKKAANKVRRLAG